MNEINLKEITRGIINLSSNNQYTVDCIQNNYYLNDLTESKNLAGDRVFGIVVESKFNVCHYITLKNNETIFGYFESFNNDTFCFFNVLAEFNEWNFDPFNSNYKLKGVYKFSTTDIKQIAINKAQIVNK